MPVDNITPAVLIALWDGYVYPLLDALETAGPTPAEIAATLVGQAWIVAVGHGAGDTDFRRGQPSGLIGAGVQWPR
jgi:hypothetical protein